MLMFRLGQWVKLKAPPDERPELRGQKALVVKVNDDDTARLRLNAKGHEVIDNVDPSDCEPI